MSAQLIYDAFSRIFTNAWSPILSRGAVAISGLFSLWVSVKYLDPTNFSKLAISQASIFIFVSIFDSSVTQVASFKLPQSKDWKMLAIKYQKIRNFIYLLLVTFLFIFLLIFQISLTPMLLATCIAGIANLFSLDWLLLSLQEKRILAIRGLIYSVSNIFFTVLLIYIFRSPEAILYSLSLSLGISFIYVCYCLKFPIYVGFSLPSIRDLSGFSYFSLINSSVHFAYNLPTFLVGMVGISAIGSAFILLYRLFSTSIMFVSPIIDMFMAKVLSFRRIVGNCNYLSISTFAKTLILSISSCIPILLIPNSLLLNFIEKVLQIKRYGLDSNDIFYIKVLIILYCIDFSLQKYLYAVGAFRNLFYSSFLGTLFSVSLGVFIYKTLNVFSLFDYFSLIFIYQISFCIISFTLLYLKDKVRLI